MKGRTDHDMANSTGPVPLGASSRIGIFLAAVLSTVVMLVASMPPWGLFPLAFVAFVPWLIYLLRARRAAAFFAAFFFGFFVFFFFVAWLRHVTVLGWVALALYLALYPLAFALLLRWVRGRLRLPIALLAPVLWVALEYLRGVGVLGFPWFLAGHSQYRFLPLIQIADLTGVHGISFIVLMVNGLWIDLLTRDRRRLVCVVATAAVLCAALIYGGARILLYDGEEGPKIALIQGNVAMDLKTSPVPGDALDVIEKHVRLSLDPATRDADLLVWAETMMPAPLNLVFDPAFPADRLEKDSRRRFAAAALAVARVARHTSGHLLIGATSYHTDTRDSFNSVHYFGPDGAYLGRYDKIHLVAFGEYTPLKGVLPFLKRFRPVDLIGPDMVHGSQWKLFDLPWGGRNLRFAATICYEDTEPRVVRRLSRKGADFLVNVSNDAWFKGSAELDQHLAIGRFRSIENRLGMARAYNSGISSFFDPLGRVTSSLAVGGERREVEGVLVGRVPLGRTWSLYRAIGDVFAWLCLGGAVALVIGAWMRRPGEGNPSPSAGKGAGKKGRRR